MNETTSLIRNGYLSKKKKRLVELPQKMVKLVPCEQEKDQMEKETKREEE